MSENCYVWHVPFGRFLRSSRVGLLAVAFGLSTGCTSTVDSLGQDKAPATTDNQVPQSLKPLQGPNTYDNVFQLVLNKTDTDTDGKVDDAFQQLFHGDPAGEAIFGVPLCNSKKDDEACIYDFYHVDIRTEGMSLGMLITVELDHQTEFDKLWNYTKRHLAASGTSSGYYNSFCDDPSGGAMGCLDPYGLQMFAMALIFAHDRWATSAVGNIDYEADALALLDVMLHKEEQNGGVVDGITNTFDAETSLVFDEPKVDRAATTRPSILMPAFYELWAQATGNAVFSTAADASRALFQHVEDQAAPNTGLMPLRAYFDGTPVPGSDTFQTEAYRVFPNMVLDEIWTIGAPSNPTEFNKVLGFFLRQGFDKYGSAYNLDGTPVPDKADHELALVIVNGITASRATIPGISAADRQRFIQAVWDLDTPTGDYRYYQGILDLFALCVLSGKMQVY